MYPLIKPVLFRLDPEDAHDLVAGLLRRAATMPLLPRLVRTLLSVRDPALQTEFAGLRLENPIGLAAGFDKRGDLVRAMAMLGFGHIEVGTVTPRPQPGNPRPRMFRLPEDAALINRLGFNSPGMRAVIHQLLREGRPPGLVIGVNIGKNRDTPLERATEDYCAAALALAPLADYLTINISSPNTPGLRRLHERDALEQLLTQLLRLNRALPRPVPVLLKISPDESPEQLEDVVRIGCAAGIDAFVATNTTLARDDVGGAARNETGGLSGNPLHARANATIARIFTLTRGTPPIIGVGGVATAEQAYAHICAGASLVQLYTGLVYTGPLAVSTINTGLLRLLQRDGFQHMRAAVGSAVIPV